ncbi:MAG: hypothetical protein ABJD97_22575, partial [Betaproteobacteria bacterium]
MSNSNLSTRMATSIALALTAAAFTACGGGATDSQGVVDTASSVNTGVSSTPDTAASAAVDLLVTTNTAAVAAATADASLSSPTPTIVASTDAATSDVDSESTPQAQPQATLTS